jgi:hypothetical protein
MHDFMAWLEASALGHAMRTSGVWAYAVVNLTHILGVSSLFGSILVLDLRLLGVWRSVSLSAISSPTIPIATIGFVLAACSGVCMLATNGTEYVGNPFILIKFPAIAIGLTNVAILNAMPAWKVRKNRELSLGEQFQLKVVGAISLASWLTAITAGRMIGYW